MYALANTTVSILRGTVTDSYGDTIDAPTAIATGIPAFLSSPSPSSFRPIILGTLVYSPEDEMPSVVRQVICVLPSNTDVNYLDQVLDETTGVTYEVYLVTQQGNLGGLTPDMQLTLRRITTTQSV